MVVEDAISSSPWSWEEEKAFENALSVHSEDSSKRWEKIAQDVPGKTLEEIKHHYELLVEDINEIDSGRVPLPNYASSSEDIGDDGGGCSKKGGSSSHPHGEFSHGGKGSRSEQERRKGIAWTEDEHRLFLLGLDKYGKGDWRSISRNFVISRTPTQVASHAQKYFIRLNSMNKDRRRASIHDITSVGNNPDVSPPQGPITGQDSGPVPIASGKPSKPSSQPLPGSVTIGQPVGGGPLVSAVGTPVGPHMAYGVRAPTLAGNGGMVTSAPMSLPPPMSHPLPHTLAHR